MITTAMICITVVICLFMVLKWAKDMSTANLPMFTYGECVWKEEPEEVVTTEPIGFKPEDTSEEKQVDEKTKREIRESYLRDPITLTASLLRGEVDIDDITT